MGRVFFTLVIVMSGGTLFADYADLVLATDRSANGEIILLMTENGLEPALEIARALAARADPYVADIIEYFFTHYRVAHRYEAERILAVLIAAFFPNGQPTADFSARFGPNRDRLLSVAGALEEFENTDLRGLLLRLAGRSGEPRFRALYARLGERIATRLEARNGKLTLDEYEEALLLLEAIRLSECRELKPVIVALARYSGERLLVERARTVLSAWR